MAHDTLWAPWRMDYLQALPEQNQATGNQSLPGKKVSPNKKQPVGPSSGQSSTQSSAQSNCFMCAAADGALDADHLAQQLVLCQTDQVTLMLNRYPYSAGHLLISPVQHVPDLTAMGPQACAVMMRMCEAACRLLTKVMHPNGFNVGMNIGIAGGAGVPGHAHLHVVPRWNGDVNFMSVFGQSRIVPQALEQTYEMLSQAIKQDPNWFEVTG